MHSSVAAAVSAMMTAAEQTYDSPLVGRAARGVPTKAQGHLLFQRVQMRPLKLRWRPLHYLASSRTSQKVLLLPRSPLFVLLKTCCTALDADEPASASVRDRELALYLETIEEQGALLAGNADALKVVKEHRAIYNDFVGVNATLPK